jgi:uncharacterized membrane protein required for colicin V production
MIGFAKIIGDLFGGYVVHISGGVLAIVLASEGYQAIAAFAQPTIEALK